MLAVLVTGSPDAYLRSWSKLTDRRPEKLQIVNVDPGSTAAGTTDSLGVVEQVSSPANLTALGVEITKVLSTWEGDGNDVAVCFDSLTALLQYVELDRVLRFLRELTDHFEAVDATAHVHVDPNAHDRQTLDSIVRVFDEVLERDS